MEKFFPPKPPLDMILSKVVDNLLTLLGRNGYNHAAITLIAHDLDTQDTALAGNLNSTGMQALLSSALAKVLEDDDAETDSAPAPPQ